MKHLFSILAFSLFCFGFSFTGWTQNNADTITIPFKIEPQSTLPFVPSKPSSNIDMKNPENMVTEVEYDESTNQYILRQKVGNVDYATPYTMTFEEYQNYDVQKNLKSYWRDRFKNESFEHQSSLIPNININSEAFETIFGSNTIDIKANGSATLKFGIKMQNNDNPSQPVELRKNTTFDFDEQIQMSVVGKIGENLEMKVSYDTESQFDFSNTMNLRYQGKEDDILQKVEVGDISMPMTTSLITGSQSLFGFLTELKFGNLYITSIFSQQQGETKTINVEGGAQKSAYDIAAVDYDKNRHFFLSHNFRANYDQALQNMPVITSGVVINKVEVWVTNSKKETTGPRNIAAFIDLGEERESITYYGKPETVILDENIAFTGKSAPDNSSNDLYDRLTSSENSKLRNINDLSRILYDWGYQGGKHYEKVEYARKLATTEYTIDDKLGYISLNNALNTDEVLAVAYEYTLNGETFKVGEFSQDGVQHPSVLFLKLLKGTNFNPILPNWKLMLKNIYSIGAYQVSKEEFKFEVEYYDDNTGTRILNIPDKSKVLTDSMRNEKFLRLLGLDNFNSSGNYVSTGDGVFDFSEGLTILAATGRVIFPVLEPFGRYMRKIIPDKTIADKLTFLELYDSTQYKAEQITSKNKFYLKGIYKSSGGSEIFLNSFNIPEGSVKVMAGGIVLQPNIDYTVDYNLGRVKILNESYLASGTPIKISLESNSMFSIQSKTLMGSNFEYRFSKDFNLGGTIMNLTERPLTEKVNMGEEPISNTIWGLNGSYRTDVPFLTKVVDFIPFIETKEMSSITAEGEFAQLIPGHNKAIGENGNAFIDDFEGSESSIDMKSRIGWTLASIPQRQPDLFPESSDFSGLESGYNRAKLAWYQIDPLFFRSGSPVTKEVQSSLQVYRPTEQDIFPNKDAINGIPNEISTLDLAFYPDERGPYNFDTDNITPEGKLEDPENRWGGIMRELTTKDFEAQNVEYIMFWMMDPFVEEDTLNTGGKLYFNLGNTSEDILKDGRKGYENGLPTSNPPLETDYYTTQWGRVPAVQALTTDFVNDGELRPFQDVGFDGLSGTLFDANGKTAEQNHYSNFIAAIENIITAPEALESLRNDPSSDDYQYFRGDVFSDTTSILIRYKNYSNSEGNTPVSENTTESYSTVGQSSPDVEDINGDYTLNESEAYFQYEIDLRKGMESGTSNITDIQTATVTLENGVEKTVKWYQFKIPINSPDQTIGPIQDFKSIRFMRMFMRGWESNIVLRFAKLELVRSEWRKYDYTLAEGGETIGGDVVNDPGKTPFAISTVNIEENGSRSPVNYVLPPGVDRQQDPSNQQLNKLNEQSMALQVIDLEDGHAKAVYKTLNMDMRDYGHLQMYIHTESMVDEVDIVDNEVSCFVRLGSDFTDNYYEYEVPLKVTPPDRYNDSDADRLIVWPEENNLDIDFQTLVDAKMARNELMRKANSELSYIDEFTYYNPNDKNQRIVVKGNPNTAQVKTIMIGVRNPKAKNSKFPDDGQPISAIVWVNELRLTDFDEKGGWAATGRVTARLADFGTVSVAGSTTQPGFGSIEQTGQERAKEETNQLDVATNLDLGKFFPKEANIRVPMFMGYSRVAINPEYDPLDQDVKMEETLNDKSKTEAEKEAYLRQVQDLTERKSINFTNVGIGSSGKGKPRFYSPSNLSASYSYNELQHYDVGIDHHTIKNTNASLSYVFNNQPKNYEPFKKSKLLKKKAFKLIGDFNFYLAPQQLSFQTSMDRKYGETLLRNLNNPEQTFTPTYDKNFYWKRQFDLKYNFSKGLKFTFSTNTNSIIIEPEGEVNKDKDSYQIYKETVWQSIQNFGSPNLYNQAFDASYTIPINKIPLLDFISSNARYAATYEWMMAPTMKSDSLNTGNNIKNNQQVSLNAQLNMDNLYNKIKYIEKTSKKYKQTKEQRKKPKFEEVTYNQKAVAFKGGVPRKVNHGLATEEEIKILAKLPDGKEIKADFDIINENRIEVTLAENADSVSIEVKGKKEVKDSWIIIGLEKTLLLATGFKQFSGTLTQTQGSLLSGYKPDHQFGELATNPGLPFIFGWQDTAFARNMSQEGYLIDSTNWVSPYTMSKTVTYSVKSTYQPFKDLRIDFASQRSETSIASEYYYNIEDIVYTENFKETGTYNINFWMLGSAFSPKPPKSNPTSEAFEQYRKDLHTIAWRLANERTIKDPTYQPVYDSLAMPEGYSSQNPDVAIPAFLSAYGGTDASKVTLNFRSWGFLRPTWRIKYDGLTNIDFLAKYFKTISLAHGYSALFTVGSYASNLNWNYYLMSQTDTSSLFIPQYDISGFTATEQFVPLIGIDMTWKNNMLTKFEYKKTRNLTMSLSNNQMAEVYTWEYVIGAGYRFDNLKIKIKTPGGGTKPLESDLNIRGDISIRDNSTIIHDLNQNTNQLTQGQKVVTTKFSADYQLSEKLMLKAYFDRVLTNPKVGSFKQVVTEFGFQIQFTL